MNCPVCNCEINPRWKHCPECGLSMKTIAASRTASVHQPSQPAASGRTTQFHDPKSKTAVGTVTTTIEGGMIEADPNAFKPVIEDRYEIVETIGTGGFAVVFKAKDRKLGDRIVAIKRLLKKYLNEESRSQAVDRFKRESTAIASLNHRNIVTVHDCSSDEDGYYIVMEFIEGGSLKDYLQAKGKLPPGEALGIVKGICQGLSFAHRKNLIHRDIKPSNIMLAPEGEGFIPKIVDFGLARMGESSDASMTGYAMGTPFYMSPEQRRDAKNVNHTTDIYAVGKILYELVTGDIPDNVDPNLMAENHGISEIVIKCLKSHPEERFFSANELIASIDSVLDSPKTSSRKAHQGAAAGIENSCPVCSCVNEINAKFCIGCGNGLFRSCPECGKDMSINISFCPECGTDVNGFNVASEALEKIEEDALKMKWQKILKTADSLPPGLKLSSQKGSAILARIKELRKLADEGSMEDTFFRDTYEKSMVLQEANEFEKALEQLNAYLEKYPEGEHAAEIKYTIMGLKRQNYKGPQNGTAWSIPGLGMELKPIKNGEFAMGSPEGSLLGIGGEKGRKQNEGPVHKVILTYKFWMGKCPVTIEDYLHFVKSPYKEPQVAWTSQGCPLEKAGNDLSIDEGFWADMRQPIIEVSWHAASAFCRWLTAREQSANRLPENYIYRLPSEAEWEYCCRAGSSTRFFFGNDQRELGDYAWFEENSGKKTHPVGLKKSNPWGLFDMHGNVWEWCMDRYDKYYYDMSINPSGPKIGAICVRRGGSWINDANHCRSAYRNFWEPSSFFKYLGFRIVLAPNLKSPVPGTENL